MSVLDLVPSIVIPTITGYIIVSWLLRNDPASSRGERVALGWGVGSGLTIYLMLLMGLAKIPFSARTVTLLLLAVMLLFCLLLLRDRINPFSAPMGLGAFLPQEFFSPRGWRLTVTVLLALWLIIKLAFVFYESTTRPIFSWDAWNHWSAAGKIFFYEKGLLLDPDSEFYFGRGYRFMGHPLLNPLLQTWTSLWLGEFHEVYAKAWSAFYFFSILGVFYYAVKREAGVFYAVLGVFFLSSIPLLTYHGTVAYSDLPLAYYGLAGGTLFWKYMRRGGESMLALSGVFVAMATLTKNEGIFFFIAIVFALAIFLVLESRPIITGLMAFLAPAAILMAPWFVFKATQGLGFGHGGAGSEVTLFVDPNYPEKSGIHWQVLPVIAKDFFTRANYNLIFPFWVLLTIWRIRDILRSDIRYLYLVIFGVMSMFLFVYLFIEFAAVVEATGLQRNTMTYLPLLLFTIMMLALRPNRNSGT